MDDVVDSFAQKVIAKLQEKLSKFFEVFDIDFFLPLTLTAKQCKNLLGIQNNDEFQRIVNLPGFPRIERGNGSHVKYPRDAVREWFNKNWTKI